MFASLPVELRSSILKYLNTKDLMHVGIACEDLAQCLPLCKSFVRFNASDFDEFTSNHLDLMYRFGKSVSGFKIQGNNIELLPLQTAESLIAPFSNLVVLALMRTNMFLTLEFLPQLPKTLWVLQLVTLPAMHALQFIKYLPPLGSRLLKLVLTGIIQLTPYDCVNILQHFTKLKYLDLRKTEYLLPGTAGTILSYCKNLDVFYLSTRFRFRESQAWLDLVQRDFTHVEFNEEVYSLLVTCQYIVDNDMFGMDSDSE